MEKEKIIKEYLKTLGIEYEELKPKTKELICSIEEMMKQSVIQFDRDIREVANKNINVKYIAGSLSISRQALYKNHPAAVTYINCRADYYNEIISNKICNISNEKNSDKEMIENLLKHEVELQELKIKYKEQEILIIKLKKQIEQFSKFNSNNIKEDKTQHMN